MIFRRVNYFHIKNNALNLKSKKPLVNLNDGMTNKSKMYTSLFTCLCYCNTTPVTHNLESIFSSLNEAVKYREKNISNSLIDKDINTLCKYYAEFNENEKNSFLTQLACSYSVNRGIIVDLSKNLISNSYNKHQLINIEEKFRNALTPQYYWLFIYISRLETGVKFLVDLRTDVLNLLQKLSSSDDTSAHVQQLNNTLRNLLLLWFSVGFLKLERITWKSSCEMLQKISDYEAVHPIRNWTDLKIRVGSDRRCFVYTHSSMPGEPLVVLHTVLRNEILSSLSGLIKLNNETISTDIDLENIKAAVFYSISSTQKGLTGVELGNHIIKRVANELTKEFPTLEQFSSLSPIPKFKSWLFEKLRGMDQDMEVFTEKELIELKNILQTENVSEELKKKLNSNIWLQMPELVNALKPILMRMCLRYLYLEKKRGYALDSVANFHLRNGAQLWRINWMADLTARGLVTSCGMMVNYRYFLNETDTNSRQYIKDKEISTSNIIKDLLKDNNLQ